MVDKLNPPESVSGVHADDCKEAFKEDDVEMARAKMRKVREENSRLKMLLEKVENDYNSLQMRFVSICQPVAPETIACTNNQLLEEDDDHEGKGNEEPDQLQVSLCLGRRSPVAEPKKHSKERLSPLKKEGGLGLDLDFCSMDNIPSPEKSPLKDVKDDDDHLLQTGVKRARVCVRARCDTPTMTDGCQWRKYGQKISKGNPCPRAYYRCTVATSCPVRKQVQRCSQDTSILITTYEGTHNHPLPFATTAMASTTSAAASMLLSGSSSSTSHPLIGLNHVPDNSRSRPYYLPSSSPTSFPTITLDLTSDNNNNNTSTTASSQFGNLFSITGGGFQSNPRSAMAPVWANGNFNYSSLQPAGRVTSQEHIYQSPFAQMNYQAAPVSSQQALTETLTKAIASDPNFRSAIAAAITTMVGGGGGGGASTTQGSNEKLEGLNKKLKLDDQAGCASSFLNQLPFSTTGSVNFSKQQPQPPFSISMGGASVTTTENVDQTKQMLLD